MATTRATSRRENSQAVDDEFLHQLYRGGELLAAGKVIEAKDYLEKAHRLQPKNEKGQNLLGLTYFKLGLFDRAAEIYEALVRENPADPTLRVNLGLVYLKTNALQRAIREFETSTDLAPEHKKAQNYLGLALAQAGEYGRAREHFLLAGSDAMAEKMVRAIAGERFDKPPPPQLAKAAGFAEVDGHEVVQESGGEVLEARPEEIVAEAESPMESAAVEAQAVGPEETLPPYSGPVAGYAPAEASSDDVQIDVSAEEELPTPDAAPVAALQQQDWGAQFGFEESVATVEGTALPVEEAGTLELGAADIAAPEIAPVTEFSGGDGQELDTQRGLSAEAELTGTAPAAAAAEPTADVAGPGETNHRRPRPPIRGGTIGGSPPIRGGGAIGSSPLEAAMAGLHGAHEDEAPPEVSEPIIAAGPADYDSTAFSEYADSALTDSSDRAILAAVTERVTSADAEEPPTMEALPSEELPADGFTIGTVDSDGSTSEGFTAEAVAVDALGVDGVSADGLPVDAASLEALSSTSEPSELSESPTVEPEAAASISAEAPELSFPDSAAGAAATPSAPLASGPAVGEELLPLGQLAASSQLFPLLGPPFSIRKEAVAIVVTQELLTRLSGLLAISGAVSFAPEVKRFRGRPSEKPFGEGEEQMVRATGNGVLLVEAGEARFLSIDLGDDSGYFREDAVYAFEEAVMFENGRVPSEVAPDLDLVHLRGKGRVLLRLAGALRSVEVHMDRPAIVPTDRLVGWHGNLTPRVVPLGLDGAARAGIELSGEGFALFAVAVE